MLKLKQVSTDDGASVVVTFVISATAILLMAGTTIDYTRSYSVKSKLQAATDSALLAAMPQVRAGATMSAIQASMKTFIVAAMADTTAAIPTLPTQSSDGTTVCVKSQASVPTTLMRMSVFKNVTVAAFSCSKFNQDSFEIALAIDTSGSMGHSALNGQSKIQSAQNAALSLISTMAPAGITPAHPSEFSIVPFTSAVNIGTTTVNQTASFMDPAGVSSIHW